ncbi:MAG: GNAT family N-acetyltransferase [Candidatus Dormibacteraeota bacterium]|nr:GNAT family N-acetyltransferase [Candidatus Dormibacteraeota bacterium]MBV9525779.1 GNAT family N-acetyltransferase [Candidatus Dormibacteraeota bacterium]
MTAGRQPSHPAWRDTADVEEYAAAVLPFLEAEPCSRNVPRWIIELARRGVGGWTAPAHFWWLETRQGARAGASWTPPYDLIVTDVPAASVASLVESVRAVAQGSGDRVAGVTGPRPVSEAVAAAWREQTGDTATLHMAQLMHELRAVADVPRPPGMRRRATGDDLELLTQWLVAFAAEAGLPSGADPRATMRTLIADGGCHVWTVRDEPVSMTGRREPIGGVARVGPVYTPPEHRGRGYARRLVAEASREALETGGAQRCMLFTDVANPVSNAIYRQIGYRPVEEHAEYSFEPARA